MGFAEADAGKSSRVTLQRWWLQNGVQVNFVVTSKICSTPFPLGWSETKDADPVGSGTVARTASVPDTLGLAEGAGTRRDRSRRLRRAGGRRPHPVGSSGKATHTHTHARTRTRTRTRTHTHTHTYVYTHKNKLQNMFIRDPFSNDHTH